MSEPVVVNGFPVPPGCEWMQEKIEVYSEAEREYGPMPRDLYIIQSIGYRAWMDEAESFDETWGSRQRADAMRNAETCRTWTPKGETK